MSWLSNMFGGSHTKNPASAAMPYLNQIPGQVQPYYQPYQQAGNDALKQLQEQYGMLMNNPGQKLSELGAGYKESPGYQATLREALAGANNAAALGGAGGLGSYGHEQLAAGAAGDVANKDYEDYLNHMLGLYQGGLGGTQGLEQQGYGANTDYAQMLANLAGTKGQYAFGGQAAQNQRQGQNWANLFSGLGMLGGGILGHYFPPATPKGA